MQSIVRMQVSTITGISFSILIPDGAVILGIEVENGATYIQFYGDFSGTTPSSLRTYQFYTYGQVVPTGQTYICSVQTHYSFANLFQVTT